MSNINLFPELDNDQEEEQEYNNGHTEYKEEELIVFGYSCKLFRDDFYAKAIDRGQSLIPWNGDENIMIDRCAKNDFLFCFYFIFTTKKKTRISHQRYLLNISSPLVSKHVSIGSIYLRF
jgi:hypothetical protein